MPVDKNLELLAPVAARLATSREEFVLVGGAVVGLLLTDPASETPRPTDDVDVIVEVTSQADYQLRLVPELHRLGFSEDIEATTICRWLVDGIKVDVMPTDSSILGFSNRWYDLAIRTASTRSLGRHTIRVISAPCFIATKLEAFRARGDDDHYGSHDLEDILAVIDGRAELAGEVAAAPDDLREYVAREIATLLANDDFLNALPGHTRDLGRAAVVLRRLHDLAALDR